MAIADKSPENIRKIINDTLEVVFSKDLRLDFMDFLGKFPDLSSENALLVFSQEPTVEFLAGGIEWFNAGRPINIDCKGEEITVLLPNLSQIEEGEWVTCDDKPNPDAFGMLTFNKYPTYKHEYIVAGVFDYQQTIGDDDLFIRNIPNFESMFKKIVKGCSIIRDTEDNPNLKENLSYFEGSEEDPVLYIRGSLTDEMADREIIKTIIDYAHDLFLNAGYISKTTKKSNVVTAVTYIVLTYYGLDTSGVPLSFLSEIDKLTYDEKIEFLDDILYLARKIIFEFNDEAYFTLEMVTYMRCLAPAFLYYATIRNTIVAQTNLFYFLYNLTSTLEPKTLRKTVKRQFEEFMDYIRIAKDTSMIKLFEKIKELDITNYPRISFQMKTDE